MLSHKCIQFKSIRMDLGVLPAQPETWKIQDYSRMTAGKRSINSTIFVDLPISINFGVSNGELGG